jgi:hypothetical protein
LATVRITAKPQLACLETVSAKWILQQEKSTLNTDREGYSNCGFALVPGIQGWLPIFEAN